MGNASIIFQHAQVGDIITHTFDGGSYTEAVFLGWHHYHIQCIPTEESRNLNERFNQEGEYIVLPHNVTHINRQLVSILPLMHEEPA